VTDIFGDIIDVDTIEQAARATLEAWLPSHLAHQERRKGLPARTIPLPRSWPTVDEFDPEPHEQLPSIVLVSPGTVGEPERRQGGRIRATWRLEIVFAVAARDERQARMIRSVYAAAIRSALEQGDPTLGGVAERTRWAGDEHAIGRSQGDRSPRALVEVDFQVTVNDVLNPRLGPSEPPGDPYDPPAPNGPLDTAEITATSEPITEPLPTIP
jgi:hypothetical protein